MMVIRNPVGLTRGSEEIYHILVDTVDSVDTRQGRGGGLGPAGLLAGNSPLSPQKCDAGQTD